MDIGEFLKKNYKFIIPIVILIFILIILLMLNSLKLLMPESNRAELDRVRNLKFDSIKELLEYYECEYINLENPSEKEFGIQINAKLRLLPYDGKVSHEAFYDDLISDIAIFYDYKNFIIYDEANSIKVKIICENGEVSKLIVNGIEDYFNKKREEFALREYIEIPTVKLTTNSQQLNDLISNGWNADYNFGTRESILDGYEIYYDEGIEVKKIQGKVYNIVFTKNYNQPVVDGLLVGDAMANVIKRIGTASFQDNSLNLVGYKGNDFYIFFTKDEISVYRRGTADVDELLAMLTQFKKEEIDIKVLMNRLTYMWPDYNKYDYNASSLYISYPLKGFEIKVNYNNERGIVFYNNFNASEALIENYLDSEDFKAYLQLDSVYIAEVERIREYKLYKEKYEQISEDFYKSSKYELVLEKDQNENVISATFISVDGKNPNRELNDAFTSYAWVSDDYFIFGKYAIGLYCYDLKTGNVQTLLDDVSKYEITESSEGRIVYDGIEQRFEF